MRRIRTGRVTNRNYPFTRKSERESRRLLFGRHGIASTSFRIIEKIGKSLDESSVNYSYIPVAEPKNKVVRRYSEVLAIVLGIIYYMIVFACSMFFPILLLVLLCGSFVPVIIMLAVSVVGGILIGIFKS